VLPLRTIEHAPRQQAWSGNSQQFPDRLFPETIDNALAGADHRDAAIADSCVLGARGRVDREVVLDEADPVAREKFLCALARPASVFSENFDFHLRYPAQAFARGEVMNR